MVDGQLAHRVETLEDCMRELAAQSIRTEREVARLSYEMRLFKDEMREFKNEMRDEMREFKDEMREFKDEMREFKDEMREFKNQAEIDRKNNDRRWGDVVNKMGSMVEDIVAPSMPRIARELFGCDDPNFFTIRAKLRKDSRTMELDALLVCKTVAIVNESKSNLTSADIDKFASKLEAVPRWYPELGDRKIVGIVSAFYPNESVVNYASRKKILAAGVGEGIMRVLNPEIL